MPPKSNGIRVASSPICEELRNISLDLLNSESSNYGLTTFMIDDINTEISQDGCPKVYGSWHLEKKYGGMDAMLDAQRYAVYADGIFPETRSTIEYVSIGSATFKPLIPNIKDVKFNDPATIVFWEDGTKTVVKAIDEPFDPEKGLAMAICKKVYGNKGNYFNKLKKWLPKEEEDKVYGNKSCATCIYRNDNKYCAKLMCFNKSAWEGGCVSCKYGDIYGDNRPCRECRKHNKWEAK